ncbi:MAG: homoserine dehydrogenase [Eubacterium sp.]|nr:homoserine dehydrogenase [Eubacterium sp.]
MINVAVLGYGTVGSGVVKILSENHSHVSRRAGEEINLKYVLDLREFPGDPVEKVLVHDFDIIVNDPEIRVIAEAMGGLEPAFTFAKKALEKGISFCTSNKVLVEAKGAELIGIAKEHNANFFFEASVGGGIPVIRPMIECLTADHFDEISGILNGTTNYMLTRMAEEGVAYDEVLAEAQELGYAERNPEADVEGHDAGRKIAILASLAGEKQVSFENIRMEGITKITEKDFAYAQSLESSIKLLGTARVKDGRYYVIVAPFLVPATDPLFAVNGVYNAIKLHGDMLENVMFYGQGAGKEATASAVVSDIQDCVRRLGSHREILWDKEPQELGEIREYPFRFLVRVEDTDAEKLSAFASALGGAGRLVAPRGISGEAAFLTNPMTETALMKAIEETGVTLIARIRAAW